MVQAQQEARALKHGHVRSEHLLLGLLVAEDGVATRVLASWNVTLELVRERVIRAVGLGDYDARDPQNSAGAIPIRPSARHLLRSAEQLGGNRVGIEHLLLAVLSEDQVLAAQLLHDLGVDLEAACRMVRELPGIETPTLDEAMRAMRTRSIRSGPRRELRPDDAVSSGGREPPTRGASFSGRFHDQPPSELDQPSVTVRQAVSESFSSAQELARAFGAPVLEPTWWPQDTGELSYRLTQTSGGGHYQIGSTRHDGIPICIVGQLEAGLAGRTPRDWLDGEWSEPPELAHVRGLIGKVGTPTRLQAAIYDQALQIQLIGYDTETEILTAARSLRRAE